MRTVITILALAAGVTATASAATLYGVNSGGGLETITVTAGGVFSFATGTITGLTGTITDIAELNNQLYAITDTQLYVLAVTGDNATATAAANTFGTGITDMVALTFGPTGVLYGTETGTTGSTIVYQIATTGANAGKATTAVTSATDINAAGDEEVIGNLLYVTTGGETGNSSLATINLTTGAFINLGLISTGATDYPEVFGLAEANGNLYGFTAATPFDILNFGSISGSITNAVTVVTAGDSGGYATATALYGATDDVSTPEPGTLGAMGLGLLTLGGFLRRRKA